MGWVGPGAHTELKLELLGSDQPSKEVECAGLACHPLPFLFEAPAHDASLGTWTTEHQLFDLLRAHSPTDAAKYVDVAGVIGALVKPDEGVCAVMMSTPKLLLDAWSNKLFGYSAGQMHLDHT